VLEAIEDGGLLLYETFGRGNEVYGRPTNPDFLLKPGELIEVVRGRLQVVPTSTATSTVRDPPSSSACAPRAPTGRCRFGRHRRRATRSASGSGARGRPAREGACGGCHQPAWRLSWRGCYAAHPIPTIRAEAP
jgi:hypothetical protein